MREKQAQAAKDEEKEEIERRRAMPEEQRLKEDMEFAARTREKEKGQMGFLQKYYHKGAFHQVSLFHRGKDAINVLIELEWNRTTICSEEIMRERRKAL